MLSVVTEAHKKKMVTCIIEIATIYQLLIIATLTHGLSLQYWKKQMANVTKTVLYITELTAKS